MCERPEHPEDFSCVCPWLPTVSALHFLLNFLLRSPNLEVPATLALKLYTTHLCLIVFFSPDPVYLI